MRPNLLLSAWALVAGLLMLWRASLEPGWTDYGNEAEPAFRALIRGDVQGFFDHVPAYSGSMVLRAPFVWAAAQLGIGLDGLFRVGALLGVGALIVLAIVLGRRMLASGHGRLPAAVVVALAAAGPLAALAVRYGHPEEAMAAAAAVGCVLAARSGKATLAGVLLGLAVGSKQWAVLAAGPMIVALPAGRVRALALAGAISAVLYAPAMLLAGNHFVEQQRNAASAGGYMFAQQIWWPLGIGVPTPKGLIGDARMPPQWLFHLAKPLIAALTVPASLFWARRRGRNPDDVLALLALLLLARCAMDPWNVHYYHAGAALALLAWEVLQGRRWPFMTLVFTACTYLTTYTLVGRHSDLAFALYFAWVLPFAGALAYRLYAPQHAVVRAPALSA